MNTFPMTTAEYEAAAMLLGLKYAPRSHCYSNREIDILIDPDTMETLWIEHDGESKFRVIIDRRVKSLAGYHRR